jgi:pimeloyl-ACP methyl ester carboxylesterase
MQKHEPGKSNLKSSDLKVTGANYVGRKYRKLVIALWLIAVSLFTGAGAQQANKTKPEPLMIQEQASFAVGGSVTTVPGTFDPIKQGAYNPAGTDPAGQTLHGDHAYVFYQVPVNARKLPLVFWHGHGQSAKTWETTPDGREGFQNIFLRRRFPVYLIDQPRRGRAARSTQPINIAATPDEQLWFGIFRLGAWPDFYPGVQFSRDPEALNQFFRQMVPNTGPYDAQVNTESVSSLFNKIGPGILVTHSQSGGPGWRTAIKNRNVRAVVSFEPGFDFPFPEGEVPPSMTLGGRPLSAITVSQSDFMLLTKIPIIIYYGDNIPNKPSVNPGQEQWRIFFEMAKRWRDVVNRHGGDVTIVHLPEIGIRGNTHFPMSDLNNVQIADQLSNFLSEKKLD